MPNSCAHPDRSASAATDLPVATSAIVSLVGRGSVAVVAVLGRRAVVLAPPEPQARPAVATCVTLGLLVLVRALEPDARLDVRLRTREPLAVRDEADLGLDLERQR